MVYVSITGLRLNGARHWLRFWWHAIPAMIQARRAEGNLLAQARTIDGIHHTLTVWRDQGAMRRYLTSGAHLAAMRVFRRIASGKTCGYLAETPPDWSQVPQIWRDQAREV